MKRILFALSALILAFGPIAAHAATPLTDTEAKQFVAAIPDMEALADKMRVEGKDAILESSVRPKAGDTDFAPYTKGATTLKEKFPGDYAALGVAATKHGFTNAEEWASAGDKVMLAYLANKMTGKQYDTLKAMANVPPEVKAKMPPQVSAQIDQALVVMNVVEKVTPADKAAVMQYVPAIDGWLNRERQKMGKTTQLPPAMKTAPAAPVKAVP